MKFSERLPKVLIHFFRLTSWATVVASGLVESANAACLQPPPGLVSWWPGEGNADDQMGSNPGLIINGVTFVPGMVGQAFFFDGADSYVRLPNNCFPMPTSGEGRTPFSFETWFATVNSGVILGQANAEPFGSTSSHVPAIYVSTGGRLRVQLFWNGDQDQLVSAQNVNDGFYHHVAVVYDGTNETVYLDAIQMGTQPFAQRAYASTYHYQLGTGFTSSQWPGGRSGDWFSFRGIIDEPALYHRALSDQEVRDLFNAGQSGKCKTPALTSAIYSSDFQGIVGPEWSTNTTSVTPLGSRRFLGQFGNHTITLSLSNLPPHTNLTVGFDLFIINSWDGNVEQGPDLFDLSVDGAPSLMHTSFSTSRARVQAFPGGYRNEDWAGHTGAQEVNNLGFSPDSVYRLVLPFTHTNSRVQIRFQGSSLQGLSDESWGLDNVVVYAGGPSINWAVPANGSVYTTPTNLPLRADAASSSGIYSVQYFANNVLLGTVTSPPFSLVWTNATAGANVLLARVTDTEGRIAVARTTVTGDGLLAEYFSNTNLTGTATTRRHPSINFDWSTAQPLAGFAADRFSIKWTGRIVPRYSEVYVLTATVDDGVRLWIDGRRVLDEWRAQSETPFTTSVALQAGRSYTIQMNYYENANKAAAALEWASPSQSREVIPPSQLLPPITGRNTRPNTPVITRPALDGIVIDPTSNLMLTTDFFSDADTGQTHLASDWQIWTVAPSNLVWVSEAATGSKLLTNVLSGGTFMGTHQGLTRLLFSTDYRLRVRHRDNSGATNDWSEWAERYFNTRAPAILGTPFLLPPHVTNTIVIGDTVSLGIVVTNILPSATYQWLRDGVGQPNATNDILTISNFGPSQAGEYKVIVRNAAGGALSSGLPLNASYRTVCGTVWEDRNADGVFNPPLLRGDRSDIVFVIDRSHSTVVEPFLGEPVGDVNGDGLIDTRLDSEIAAFIALNQSLVRQQFTNHVRIAIVSFGDTATNLDLNPITAGMQIAVAPDADANGNGTNDVEEVLRSVRVGSISGTDFHLALLSISNVFSTLGTSNNGSLVFVSDGESDREGLLYTNDVAVLNQAGVYMRAFGVGSNSLEFLPNLQLIDPNAEIFTTSDQLVAFFGGPTSSLFEPEHGLAGITLYVDLNNNGKYDPGEPTVISAYDDLTTPNEDETGRYCLGNLTASPVVLRVVSIPEFATTFGMDGQSIADVHDPLLPGINFGLARRAHLRLVISPAGQVTLIIERPGGIDHRIEVSSDVKTWITVTNILNPGSVASWIDTRPANARARFYRAVQR